MRNRRVIEPRRIAVVLCLILAPILRADDGGMMSPAQREFFEERIRPVLSGVCAKCHGAETQKNGLRLDSRRALLEGGDGGAVIVPGEPDESLLIAAISGSADVIQMPPNSRLSDDDIAALTKWVKNGAPWPSAPIGAKTTSDDSLAGSRHTTKHWSFLPLRKQQPPEVQSNDRLRTPVDNFIIEGLEEADLSPASPADKRTLLCRVYFDLVGLPPTTGEVDAFLNDDSPTAYEEVVERLLASPHYGERWARHWLDLVRFAENTGFARNHEIHHAWPYRDYVIRAMNDDVPYTQFVTEHIAGDLLVKPRRHLTEDFNESVIGTALYWFGTGTPEPNDLRAEECDRINDQIDVISRAFLGLSVTCARCHDHKYDDISIDDYYAFAGFLKSTRRQFAQIDSAEPAQIATSRLRQLKPQLLELVKARLDSTSHRPQRYWPYYVFFALGGAGLVLAVMLARRPNKTLQVRRAVLFGSFGFAAMLLGGFVITKHPLQQQKPGSQEAISVFLDQAAQKFAGEHQRLADSTSKEQFSQRRKSLAEHMRSKAEMTSAMFADTIVFEDFDKDSYEGWRVTGEAFGNRPSRRGDFTLDTSSDSPLLRLAHPGLAHSGLHFAGKLRGVLRSGDFLIPKKFILFRMRRHTNSSGAPYEKIPAGDVHVICDGYFIDHFDGEMSIDVEFGDRMAWYALDVSRWVGHRAYIEIVDDDDDFIVVDKILFSDTRPILKHEQSPAAPNSLVIEMLEHPDVQTFQALTRSYRRLLKTTLQLWASDQLSDSPDANARLNIMNRLFAESLGNGDELKLATKSSTTRPILACVDEYDQLRAQIAPPRFTLAATDGTDQNEYLLIRGDHKHPGSAVSRAFLEVLAGPNQAVITEGSGRLEFARRITNESSPLLARVIVNRLWQHHFGRGIVATADEFGMMGERPTHPELLEFLASRLIQSGYSLKQMHRLMVLSSTYRMSSENWDPLTKQQDPQNKLVHRMPLRRLEAEVIRDSMLALGGNLDQKLYGPGIAPYTTHSADGNAKPDQSGPLDGDGRRSIYVTVRRNALTPLLMVFDFPPPENTVGQRSTSSTPSQALTMMNNPFVVQQASLWANRILTEEHPNTEARITRMYKMCFGRSPTATETKAATEFLRDQENEYGRSDQSGCWADLCHILLNCIEFTFAD
jgi:hypothetical protein